MKILNGTAHQINIYEVNQCDDTDPRKLIVNKGENPVYTIPAGVNLNAQKGNRPSPTGDFPFPVTGAVTFQGYDPLPSGYDIYIVSNLYRSAVAELGGDTSNLATVNGVVYADPTNPRPCRCLGLAVG